MCVCLEFRWCLVCICYLITKTNKRGDEGVVVESVCGVGRGVMLRGGAWCGSRGNRSQLHDNATIDGGRRGGCVVYIGIIKSHHRPRAMRVKRINQPGDMIFPATISPLYAVQSRAIPEGIVKSDRQMACLHVIERNNNYYTTGPHKRLCI